MKPDSPEDELIRYLEMTIEKSRRCNLEFVVWMIGALAIGIVGIYISSWCAIVLSVMGLYNACHALITAFKYDDAMERAIENGMSGINFQDDELKS
jgi:hypothetical protein